MNDLQITNALLTARYHQVLWIHQVRLKYFGRLQKNVN